MASDYLQPYQEAQMQHGSDFDVTLWASQRTQQLRFRVFTEMLKLKNSRILDAGCSRGDFSHYLVHNNIPFAKYTGVDGLPDVVEYARQKAPPNCEFRAGDFVQNPELLGINDPQFIVISGTLNTMTMEIAVQVLDAAWKNASQALVFNFLSDRCGNEAPTQLDPARRLDTLALLDWALKQTPCVRYRQDYFPHGHDATIALYK